MTRGIARTLPGEAVKGETSTPTLPPTDTIGPAVVPRFRTPARLLARRKARH